MTVRECINEMRKVYTNTIYTNNGTKIVLMEINPSKCDCFGTTKFKEDGQVILRRILCNIRKSENTQGVERLIKDQNIWMFDPGSQYNYFRETDFCIPERKMNEFISLNGGIDHYRTITEYAYMMADALLIMD